LGEEERRNGSVVRGAALGELKPVAPSGTKWRTAH